MSVLPRTPTGCSYSRQSGSISRSKSRRGANIQCASQHRALIRPFRGNDRFCEAQTPVLDERQRRLFAGLQAAQLGHGGDRIIAELLGLDVHTVAKGRQEAFSEQSFDKRLRKKGGGRKSVQKKRRTSGNV